MESIELRVHLKDSLTNLEGWHSEYLDMNRKNAGDPGAPDWDAEAFYWTDGNSSCDCVRGKFLAEVLNLPKDHELRSLSCAGKRIQVLESTIGGQPFDIKDHGTC